MKNNFHPRVRLSASGMGRLKIFSLDHLAKLKNGAPASSKVADIYQATQKVYLDFVSKEEKRNRLKAERSAATRNVNKLLYHCAHGKMSELRGWQLAIESYNRTNSPAYNANLLLSYSASIRRGAKDLRIDSIKGLGLSLESIEGLQEVRESVNQAYQQLFDAREAQQMYEQKEAMSRNELSAAKQTLVDELCHNWDSLAAMLRENRQHLAYYFDLNLLKTKAKNSRSTEEPAPEEPSAPDLPQPDLPQDAPEDANANTDTDTDTDTKAGPDDSSGTLAA